MQPILSRFPAICAAAAILVGCSPTPNVNPGGPSKSVSRSTTGLVPSGEILPSGRSLAQTTRAFKPVTASYTITVVQFNQAQPLGITGINALGEMAGMQTNSASYADCDYSSSSTLTDITPNYGNCSVGGMNASGTLVGSYDEAEGPYSGIAWANGQWLTIDSSISGFYAINDSGLTVASQTGSEMLSVYDLSTAKFLYSLYDAKSHCAMSFGWAITNGGVVLGQDTCNGGKVRRETATRKGFNYFHIPNGFDLTRYTKSPINDLQQIIIHKAGTGHAFLWSTKGGTPLDLGALSEDQSGFYSANALNNTTAIGVTSHQYAWIWTARTGIQNLANLVPPNSYGNLEPEVIDPQGDIGCVTSTGTVWLYLKPS